MTQPTLDLFSTPPRTLQKPRLAAVAMTLFTATYAFLAIESGSSFFSSLLGISPAEILIWRTAASVLAIILEITGLAILCVADLARGQVNPWPRRILLVSGLLSDTVSLFLYAVDFLEPTFLFFKPEFNLAFGLFLFITESIAWIAAIVYTLQLARRLQRRSLAIASLIVFGVCLLSTLCGMFQTLHWYIVTLREFWDGHGLDAIYDLAAMLSVLAAAIYFCVLAVALFRVRPVA